MRRCARALLAASAVLAIVFGCRDTRSSVAPEGAYRVAFAAPASPVAAIAGGVLPVVVPVRVTGPDGAAVAGVRIRFRVVRGADGGTRVEDDAVATEPTGTAAARVLIGPDADTVVVAATLAVDNGTTAYATIVAAPGPRIASVAPGTAGPGDTVTIVGSEFGNGPYAIRFAEIGRAHV